jgi:energy-converting hydrogenase B subunit D
VVVATLAPLQGGVLVLVALGATAVVLSRDPLRMIVVNGVYGLLLVVLFFVLQAPDVALAEVVVGTAVVPLMVLLTLRRIRRDR